MTLSKVVVDVSKRIFCRINICGLFQSSSTHLLFTSPFSFQRLANLSKSSRLQDRLKEDARLMQLSARTPSGGKIARVSGSPSHEEHIVNGITTDSIPFQEQPNADNVTAENVPSLPTPQQLTVEEVDQSSAEIPTGSPQIPPEDMDQEPATPHGAMMTVNQMCNLFNHHSSMFVPSSIILWIIRGKKEPVMLWGLSMYTPMASHPVVLMFL